MTFWKWLFGRPDEHTQQHNQLIEKIINKQGEMELEVSEIDRRLRSIELRVDIMTNQAGEVG